MLLYKYTKYINNLKGFFYGTWKGGLTMQQKVKAKIKGVFWGTAVVILDSDGTIIEVEEVEDLDDFDDCEVREIIYKIG